MSLGDPLRRALYAFVAGRTEAVGREEAAASLGIRRGLAAFHLDKLAEQGLLEVEYRRLTGRRGPGAGRPAKLYRRSSGQVEVSLPPREYRLAAEILAEAADQSSAGPLSDVVDEVAYRRGAALGAEAADGLDRRTGPSRRRALVEDVLRTHGFEPFRDNGDVRLRNCPFHALAQRHPQLVCGMNRALLAGLLEGAGAGGSARLDPRPGECCVVIASNS